MCMCVCLGSTMSQWFYYINNMYNISMGFVFHVNLVEKIAKQLHIKGNNQKSWMYYY